MGPLGDAVSFVDAGKGHSRQLIGRGQAAGSRSASANQGLGGQQQHLHLALLHLHREHRIREKHKGYFTCSPRETVWPGHGIAAVRHCPHRDHATTWIQRWWRGPERTRFSPVSSEPLVAHLLHHCFPLGFGHVGVDADSLQARRQPRNLEAIDACHSATLAFGNFGGGTHSDTQLPHFGCTQALNPVPSLQGLGWENRDI